MYITAIPNRHSPPAILLRESFRDVVGTDDTLAIGDRAECAGILPDDAD